MNIQTAQFTASYEKFKQIPEFNVPEFCFIGRSNVGKSSLINLITGRKDLAKVSSTPGKTKAFNYFKINNTWYLVDLPGYGYAKRSKTLRNLWEEEMKIYFLKRANLSTIFLLVDSRIKPQSIDLELINFFGENGIPFSIVFTKADKRELKNCKKNINFFLDQLKEDWEPLPNYFITSSEERMGGKEILDYIYTLQ